MRTRTTLFLLFIGCATSVRPQEQFGIAHSNYAGADAISLNPARSAGQWPYMDIRLFGADLFVWNSLVAWSGRDRPLVGELRSGISSGSTNGDLVLRDASSVRSHKGFAQMSATGPAISVSLGRSSIGAGIRSRSAISTCGISPALGNFIFHGLGYRPQHGIRYQEEGARAIGAAWTEFALNYARILKAEGFGMFSAGVAARYDLAHAGALLQFDQIDYTVMDSARLMVHETTASYGFAQPAFSAGDGWGADLGLSYERSLEEADGYLPHRGSTGCDPMRYRYRIGLSLIDLGGMKFKAGQAGGISAGSVSIADYTDLPIDSQQDLDSLLATSTHWSRRSAFSIGAPTAVALQYDQRAAEHVYVAFDVIQNVSDCNSVRLRRPNSIAFTPRFEMKHVEAALPVVIHEYDIRHPSIGFMLRLGGVVIGSDHILPFINKRNMFVADAYFRVRWMIHRSPFCKGKRRSNAPHRAGSTASLPCATPND